MHKNFGGSLYEIQAIEAKAFFIEAVNLLRIALRQVRGLAFLRSVQTKQTADGVTSIPL